MPKYSFSTYVIDIRMHISWCLSVSKKDYSAVWVQCQLTKDAYCITYSKLPVFTFFSRIHTVPVYIRCEQDYTVTHCDTLAT